MNKTDRLLAIVLELQRTKWLRAEDLATTFETSVRTIYRDMQALSEAGVPIIGAPGTGYSLMEGYFLPPVSFTVEEAVAMLVGADFVGQKFDEAYGSKAKSARGKIEAILPVAVRSEADRVRSAIRLLAMDEPVHSSREKKALEQLRGAILEQRKVEFHYTKAIAEADGNRSSVRAVAPYGLVLMQGRWILVGWCELRQSIRHFRLSRMKELALLDERFSLPPGFDLQAYRPPDDRQLEVRLLVNRGITDKVKEANPFFLTELEEREDGVHASLRVRQIEEVLPWVLGWGAEVVVLEPESLRIRVREEAQNILNRY